MQGKKNLPKTAKDVLRLAPQDGPQTAFLASEADITIFGGSAGGGKSYGLLLEPLRYVGVPRFNCTIFRRTSPMIRNAGGLWDTSMEIYPHLNGKPTESRLLWKFPHSPEGKNRSIGLSGAEIRFAHLEYEQNKRDFDGSQICMLAFDELQHFTESMFFYMLSRNRSTCGVKPFVRATCMPDSESWLRRFLDWWIGEDGLAIPERSGKIRYFTRVDGVIKWGDSKNQLLKHNEDFVSRYEKIRGRYLKEKEKIVGKGKKRAIEELKAKSTMEIYKLKDMALNGIKSVTFIGSSVYDNRILLESNPSYLSNLRSLPKVEREQMLNGNWNIKAESGKFFNKDWFEVVEGVEIPQKGKECRYWDFAATAPSKKNKDPDYTIGIKMRKCGQQYFIISVVRERLNPAELEKLFLETTLNDRKVAEDLGLGYIVRWEQEGGASGKNETYRLQSLLAGYDAKGCVVTGKSKETRAKPLAVQSEIGNIKLMKADWNDAFLSELHMFTDPSSKHDDQVDACSGAFSELTSVYIHPTMVDDTEKEYTKEELAERREDAYNKLGEEFLEGDD